MTLIPLDLPPGIVKDGAEYSGRGRWRDGNLVRWKEGVLQPIGGTQVVDFTPYGGLLGTEGSGNYGPVSSGTFGIGGIIVKPRTSGLGSDAFQIFVGTTSNIERILDNASTPTVTTSGLTTGSHTGSADGTTESDSWSFGIFGDYVMAMLTSDGDLWELDITGTSGTFVNTSGAPTGNKTFVVTPEQFVMIFGAGGDPRKVQWCDRGDRTSWTPSALNQAGDFTMNIPGFVRQAVVAKDQILILTTDSIWRCVYVGYPEVYEFTRVANISCISDRAAIQVDDSVYWMSQGAFHRSNGAFVEDLPCPLEEWVFEEQMNLICAHRTFGWHHEEENEVWWHFVTGAYNQLGIDTYIAYNYAENYWHHGTLDFQLVLPRGVLKYPLGLGGPGASNRLPNADAFFYSDSGRWTLGTNWVLTPGTPGTLTQSTPTASTATLACETSANSAGKDLYVGFYYNVTLSCDTVATGGTLTVQFGDGTGVDSSGTMGTELNHTFILRYDGSDELRLIGDGTWDGILETVGISTLWGFHYIDVWDQSLHSSFYDRTDSAPYAETGALDLENGERRVHVHQVYPDAQEQGDLTFTFKTKEYPNGSETTHGPYTASEPMDTRFSGRQFKMRVEGPNTQFDQPNGPLEPFRSGTHRLDVTLGGKR
jgi:hypothetical protein